MVDQTHSRERHAFGVSHLVRHVATPLTAVLIALLLLVAGLASAFQLERVGQLEKIRQITAQAQTLAGGIAAPLAFDDDVALQEHLNALHADPQIVVAAAFRENGDYAAGFTRSSAHLPKRVSVEPPRIRGNALAITVPVMQEQTRLGFVHLEATVDSLSRRLTRYLGIAVIVVLAALLIIVLAASYGSLRKAHQQLQEEIASRLQAEDALRQSQKMEAMGQLTGGVAHDFNNLLMVASGALDLMERTDDPVKLERLRAGIRQAVDRGGKLTQQLLAFSRRMPLKPEVIDLRARILGMDALLERSLGENIEVLMRLPAGLWPIEVDASELEIAILNVCLNARDAMAKGGVITIEASNLSGSGDKGDQLCLAISDSGEGIPAELIEKIFEPFYTTKAIGKGTGLGLSQVYGFARASGGEVQVDSVLYEGTTIRFLLPRSLQVPVVRRGIASPRKASGLSRIFVVEDDHSVAETVTTMLAELGYQVERAGTADAALKRLEEKADFGLLLSDMIMPGELNGIDLVRIVRQQWPTMPTMLMTGYSAAAASAAKEGIHLLTKPFTIQDLAIHILGIFGEQGVGSVDG